MTDKQPKASPKNRKPSLVAKRARPVWAFLCRPKVNRLLLFTVLFIAFFLLSWTRMDADFGWHLVSGNYFRAHGLPAHDIFTYTAQQFRWIDHEWGNDVIVSFVYGLGGYTLLAVLYSLLWSGGLMIIGWRVRWVTMMIAMVALFPYAGIRAIAWTFFLMAITLRILQSDHKRLKWALPLLFIPWANLHAGFIIGLFLIAFFWLRQRKPYLLAILGLSALATLVNAYGPRLYIEVFRTLFDPAIHTQVTEWRAFFIQEPSQPFVYLWLVSSMLLLGLKPKKWFRLSSLLFVATLSASRNLPLFVVASLEELDNNLKQIWQMIPKKLDAPRRMVLGLIVGGFVLALLQGVYLTFWPLTTREAPYPTPAISYLRIHGCDGGQLFNDYNYGGYLIWKLPSQPVYIDGRMTAWQDPSGQYYLTRYLQIIQHKQDYKPEFQKYDIRCVLLARSSQTSKLVAALERDHWRVAVLTNGSILLLAPQSTGTK